jgi:hypothetical protein
MSLSNRRLPWQQPIQSKQKEIFVYSEEELIEAIGSLVIETNNFPGLKQGYFPGKIIRIGKGFTVTKTIDIPREAIGLVLDGTRTSMVPGENGMTMFKINGPLVTIKDFICAGGDGTATAFFGTFIELASTGSLSFIQVLNNVFTGTRLVDGRSASDCDGIIIDQNICEGTGTCEWVSLINCDNGSITNNKFDGDTAVVLGADCSACSIALNKCSQGDITTSASDGLNAVVGNTDVDVLTLAGTDSNVGNT